jgi:hypothetical protein
MKNKSTIHFEQNFTMGTYKWEFDTLGVVGELVKYMLHSSPKKI